MPDQLPMVSVVMGSRSDWDIMSHTVETLHELCIPNETKIISAHRTPDKVREFALEAEGRGIEIIIAGAGLAAALPGAIAAHTIVPVLGVPLDASAFGGVDSLLSMVQMPAGIPVGVLAVGKPGAINAALLAAAILARKYHLVHTALKLYRHEQKARAEGLINARVVPQVQ